MTDIDTQSADHIAVDFLSYDQFVVDPDNVRSELTDIEQLADSIWAVGLLNPITVRKNGDGKFHITAGYRRHAALGLLIKQKRWARSIPVIVRTDEDDESRLVAMIVENLQRVDVNPVDEALGIQRLIVDYSFSVEDVALNLAMSEDVVRDRLALCSLSDDALALVRDHKLSIESGVALSKGSEAVQRKLVSIVKKEGAQSWNSGPQQIRSMISAERKKGERALLVAEFKAHDIKVTQGVGYRYQRVADLAKATADKIGKWITENGIVPGDCITIGEEYGGGWSCAKWTERPDPTPGEYEPMPYEAPSLDQNFAQNEIDLLSDEIKTWYAACGEVEALIENGRADREAATNVVRAQFIHDLGKADVAAAALRSLAKSQAWPICRALQSDNDRDYVLAALGVTMADLTPPLSSDPMAPLPSPDERYIIHVLFSKPSLVVRAAAMALCSRHGNGDLEAAFQDAVVAKGTVEALPTFPPLPPELEAYVVASGDEADPSDHDDLDRLIDGYLTWKSEMASTPEAEEDGPTDEELAAIEAESDDDE